MKPAHEDRQVQCQLAGVLSLLVCLISALINSNFYEGFTIFIPVLSEVQVKAAKN